MIEILIALILLAIPPAAYFPTLGARRVQEHQAAYKAVRDLDVRIESARAAQRKLAEFHEELGRLTAENEKLRRILPLALAIDDVRALTGSYAAANGVRFVRFEPRKPVRETPAYDQIEIEVEVTGSGAATAGFLREIENTSRIFHVSAVTMLRDPAGWRTSFVMTAFALPD